MDRVREIRDSFKELKIDGFLVSDLANIRYLCGFSGSAGMVLITRDKNYFVSDFRYKVQAAEEISKDFKVIIYKQNSMDFLNGLIKKHNLKRIGFESSMLYSTVESLKQEFGGMKFVPVSGLVESIVDKKTEEEIAKIKKAVDITDKAFKRILKKVKPGKTTEKQLAAEIGYIQQKLGGSKNSFDPIVASGERSAYPHAQPTDKVISSGDLLTLDFGTVYEGFCSDMTRTVAIGEIPEKATEIYNIVKEAQEMACGAIKAGVPAKKVDAAARGYITKKGYGPNFGHGLGHGLGYYVHENPRLNRYSDYKLEVNNVVTVEPGIYVEGLGGVRIEDDVVVKEDGGVILNKSSKDLIVLLNLMGEL